MCLCLLRDAECDTLKGVLVDAELPNGQQCVSKGRQPIQVALGCWRSGLTSTYVSCKLAYLLLLCTLPPLTGRLGAPTQPPKGLLQEASHMTVTCTSHDTHVHHMAVHSAPSTLSPPDKAVAQSAAREPTCQPLPPPPPPAAGTPLAVPSLHTNFASLRPALVRE